MASSIITTLDRNNPMIIAITLDGVSASAAITGPGAELMTLTDNGTGDYTLTFATALAEPPAIFAPMSKTQNTCAMLHTTIPTTTVVKILTKTIATSPAAVDAVISLIMVCKVSPTIYNP